VAPLDADEEARTSITPLRKKTLNGKLYTRAESVEAKLGELLNLSRTDLATQCLVKDRKDSAHVPSECLLYLIRARRSDEPDENFERLYKILLERVLRSLPKVEGASGNTLSLTNSNIRDGTIGQFLELLAADRVSYSERLDYFEVRFDGALANLRRDAQEKAWREENRAAPLEDEETGKILAEVEHAVGSFDPFDVSKFDAADYRLRLDAAIDALPLLQRRIVEMIRQGIPIDSKETRTITITKTLEKAEKTIRTHRDKAYKALREALK
jgi:hypothetical protein